MWCKTCNKIVYDKVCPTCGGIAQEDVPTEVFWCEHCNVPIIKEVLRSAVIFIHKFEKFVYRRERYRHISIGNAVINRYLPF